MALVFIGFVGVLTVDDYARNAVKDIFNGLVLILAGLSLAALGIMKVLTGIGNFNGTAIERHQPAYARTWKNDCDKISTYVALYSESPEYRMALSTRSWSRRSFAL